MQALATPMSATRSCEPIRQTGFETPPSPHTVLNDRAAARSGRAARSALRLLTSAMVQALRGGCSQTHQPTSLAQSTQLQHRRAVRYSSRNGASSSAARVAAAAGSNNNGATGGGSFQQRSSTEQQQPQQPKVFVFLRHGHSTWNEQHRIQGNTNESALTPLGQEQALRARAALSDIAFDRWVAAGLDRRGAGPGWRRASRG